MKKYAIILLLLIANCQLSIAQVGSWRNYLSYAEPKEIQQAGNYLFVLASGGLYQYNQNDQSIYTYDKINGMSDVDISHIRWCQQAKRLVVVYSNSNIDLVETNGNITNISDLYTKTITGDKTVSSIRIDGKYAYLICTFGIVKVDVQRAEIAETYTPNHPDYPTELPAEDNSDYDKYIDVVKTLKPGGPQHNYFGYMLFSHNKLYTANGDYNHGVPIQVLDNNKEWIIYQYEGISDATGVSFPGSFCFDVDPTNENHIFAGARNGLYEYRNGKFVKYYANHNSPIESFNGTDKEYQIIAGVKFDQEGNVWILNSSAPTTALVKYTNETFKKFDHQELMKLNTRTDLPNRSNAELSKIIIDSQGIMWFVNNNWVTPAFYQYNIQNDDITAYENFVNQDGTHLNINSGVKCVVEDLNHDLWIGSDAGPFVLERDDILEDNPSFIQVKVPRNDGTNYADYLLSGINITSIAIDGANRKWFGTVGNGVYLISADNMVQIQHFTTDNSPLLSNSIQSIAINPTSGEVFFGTEMGLCSFMSDATVPNDDMTKDNVWAYPNPVEPGYTGPITITGLTLDADIKILAANGALVSQGRSNGGTYTWDGCDQQGRRVASGVYMVATATNSGEKGTICKIAIVR